MKRRLPYIAIAVAAVALPSFAQQVISAKSGLLSYAEGDVKLDGQPVDFSGVHFSDVKEKSVVTTADGRAEVLLTPGVVFRLGENSSMRMISNRLIDTRVELLTGSAVIEADQIAKDTNVTVLCKDGTVTMAKAGIYRLNAEPAQLKVFKGDAEVEIAGATQGVTTGHELALSGTPAVARFDAEQTDSLDRWSHRRASYLAMANASAANTLVNSSGTYGGTYYPGYGYGYGMAGWGMAGCNSAWMFNTYYNMMTYMPCYGSLYSPYGYPFYSPYTIYRYNGWAPTLFGGGAGRTGLSSSGSASLARPVATASNRSNAPAAGFGTSRGSLSSGAYGGRVGSASSFAGSAGSAGGGFSGSGGGFSGGGGGGHMGGGGGSTGGGGGHAGGGGGGHGR